MSRSESFNVTLVASAAVLSGCAAQGGHAQAEPVQAPGMYTAGPTATAQGDGGAQRILLGQAPPEDWWTQLRSPALDQVVSLALEKNLSLAVVRSRVARAQEELTAARGARQVRVDAAANVSRLKYGSSFLGPEAATFPVFSEYAAGPQVSYDLDLSGHTRHRIEAAGAQAEYEHEQLRAARLQVIGDTVLQALAIAAARAQIEVIGKVLDADEETLRLTLAAHHAGVVSEADVLQATAQRDEDRTQLPALRQQLDAAQDALAVLAGRSPAEWTAPEFALDGFSLPHELRLVVPSELVHARPDIRAAEAQLHESSARVGIATADLYPRITLSAEWAASGLLSGGTENAWSLIGGVTAPLFHGGALLAHRRAAQDDYQAAVGTYQLVVLGSFAQVADILHALDHDAEERAAQEQALASAGRSLELVRQGYRAGNTGVLELLTAQRSQELARLGLTQARTRQLADTVRLHLASGGGGG